MRKHTINLISISLFVIILINIFSCDNSKQKAKEKLSANISINIDTFNINNTIYIYNIGSKKTTLIDSVSAINDKEVSFDISVNQSIDIFSIAFAPNQTINIIVSNGEEVKINLQNTPFNLNYSITGSEESQKLLTLNSILNKHITKHDSIYSAYRMADVSVNKKELRNRTDSLLKDNYEKVYEELKAQIRNNPASLSSLMGLYSKFGNSPILNFDIDFELFNLVADSLIAKYPNNTHAIALAQKVLKKANSNKLKKLRYQQLNTGNLFPKTTLYSIDNQEIKISTIQAKYKIIYLWKSTKGNFFEYNKVLRKLYKKLSPQSNYLEIIGISFEKDKLIWKNFCKMEKMQWINLIADNETEDLINPTSKFCMIYLLDSHNNIITRDVDITNLETLIQKK